MTPESVPLLESERRQFVDQMKVMEEQGQHGRKRERDAWERTKLLIHEIERFQEMWEGERTEWIQRFTRQAEQLEMLRKRVLDADVTKHRVQWTDRNEMAAQGDHSVVEQQLEHLKQLAAQYEEFFVQERGKSNQ